MDNVVQLFRDRRTMPMVQRRTDVLEHLAEHHGHVAGPRTLLNDAHDTHDALHQMPSNHSHEG